MAGIIRIRKDVLMIARTRLHLCALAFYGGLTVLLMSALLWYSADRLAGTGVTDYFHFHWNYAWLRHALTNALNPYETNYVMTPAVTNLGLHTLAPLWLPLWVLIEPWGGTLLAMNVIFVVGVALMGYSLFALLRWWRVPSPVAVLCGAAWLLLPTTFSAIYNTHANLIGWFWLPLLLLTWARACHATHARPMLGWCALFGAVLWGAGLTDLQYGFFAPFVVGPYVLWTLWRARRAWRPLLRLIGGGVLAAALALALLWWVGPLAAVARFDPRTLAASEGLGGTGVTFPWGYWARDDAFGPSPTVGGALLPLLIASAAAAWWVQRRASTTAHAATPAPITSARQRKRATAAAQVVAPVAPAADVDPYWHGPLWLWAGAAVLPCVFSLGAYVTIGEMQIVLPFQWLHETLNGMFRHPVRFVPLFALPLLVVVALSARAWWPRVLAVAPVWRIGGAAAVALLLIAESGALRPFPTQAAPYPYQFYTVIGQETRDLAVLEVPTNAGSGEIWFGELEDIALQYYGVTHGKRMVNGLLARAPINNFWYLRDSDPLLSWLGQRRLLDVPSAAFALEQVIYTYPVGYIVVHQDHVGLTGPTNQEILGFFNSLPQLLCPLWVEGPAVVYRTAAHPDGCPPRTPTPQSDGALVIDLGTSGDERYIGWGWHRQEQVGGLTVRWSGQRVLPDTPHANGDGARLYLDLAPADYFVEIQAQAYAVPRRVSLTVNGVAAEPLGDVIAPMEGLVTLVFRVPQSAWATGISGTLAGQNTLAIAAAAPDGQRYPAPDGRELALMIERVTIRPSP
jgi:hypothetical protein